MKPRRGSLPLAARVFRCAHAGQAAGFLVAIGYLWWCGLAKAPRTPVADGDRCNRNRGALVAANRGSCSLGELQERLGDPDPLFELVLPARAAHLAVPVLGAVTAFGLALAWRRPRRQLPALIRQRVVSTARPYGASAAW